MYHRESQRPRAFDPAAQISTADKVMTPAALAARCAELRAQGRTVVQCHGCFDIVHPGHIAYLEFAKTQGNVLVVSVSGDGVVGKAEAGPYINQDLRAKNLAALQVVDYVCIDDNTWAGPILELIRPNVYVKGKEYEKSVDARFAKEKALVEAYGGSVVFSSGDVVFSSTAIINQRRASFGLEQQRVDAYCKRNAIHLGTMLSLLGRAAGLRIAVIGDPILDQYIHCESLGVASESPIMSLTPITDEWFVGGAGLIALQAQALGASVRYVTCLSPGPLFDRFQRGVEDSGVELDVLDAPGRPIYQKTRYLVDDQKLLKVDHGRRAPLSTTARDALVGKLGSVFEEVDCVIVSDFGYGMFGSDVVDALSVEAQRTGTPYVVDVSQSNILKFKGPALATPTEQELRFAFADKESGLSNLASRYYRETHASRVAITLGKGGALLFGPESSMRGGRLRTEFLPALGDYPFDPVGAGDVFLVGMSLAVAAQAPLEQGLYLGSVLSATHIEQVGNGPTDLAHIEDVLRSRSELHLAI